MIGRKRLGLAAVVAVVVLVASSCVLKGSWTALSPAPPTPPPGESVDAEFADVSCPTADFCMAVGASVADAYGSPVFETWDGSVWSEVAPPVSSPESDFWPAESVACTSATECFAIVPLEYDGDIWQELHAWDGTSWTSIGEWVTEDRSDVDCAPDGTCMVVTVSPGGEYSFFDGESWSEMGDTSFQDGGLVACGAAEFCVQPSWAGDVEQWDGVEWSVDEQLPLPPGEEIEVRAVDCTSATHCVTAGRLSPSDEPVVFTWNGVAWTMASLPVSGPGVIETISCPNRGECVALGEGSVEALARVGSKWYEIAGPPAGASTDYTALSCVPETCVAVGFEGPANATELVASLYDWTDGPAPGAIVVNTPLDGPDADPGDGVCEINVGEGDCSLRAAIDETNADPDQDLVTIAPGVDPVLTFMGSDDENAVGDLDVLDDLRIVGQGATVDGNVADRVFHAYYDEDTYESAELRLISVTVTGAAGPGIEAVGSLYLDASEVSGNGGRGIDAWSLSLDGEVVITRSVISDNGHNGIDVSEYPQLLLVDTVLQDNEGNGVELWLTPARVIGSTFTGNAAAAISAEESETVEIHTSSLFDRVSLSGTGLVMSHSVVVGGVTIGDIFEPITSSIVNSTIVSDNYFAIVGSADEPDAGTLDIVDSTISGSYLDGVMVFSWFDVRVRGSIFVGDSAPVCGDPFEDEYEVTSQGRNIASDDSCAFDDPTDLVDTDPLLGPLADNGGPTWTRLPGSTSPALDAVPIGTAGLCDGSIPTDQRGVSRPRGSGCDIGAVERE